MEDLVTLIVLGTFVSLLLIDALRPARALPVVRGWRLKGIAFFVLYMVIAIVLPLAWGDVLAQHRLIDASGLGMIGGAIVGILVADLAQYVWHLALHHVPFLWRWFHQMHHSAERVDTAGAFYFSPLDILGFTLVASLALVWAVGITPEAAALASCVLTILAIFQHANVRTPAWLGYLVQRPEAHALHHGRDVHGFNYGSLAIWDLVCGTWRNPRVFSGETGFYPGASREIAAMLVGRDLAAEHQDQAATLRWRPRGLLGSGARGSWS